VRAESRAHHDAPFVVVLGPGDLAGVKIQLPTDADHVLGEVEVWVMQREQLTGAHRLLAHRKDRPLDDEPVVVGAARAGALAQALILLVGDDLEVGLIDAALALAGAQAGEVVAVDQLAAVERAIEELADCLLGVCALRERPGNCLVGCERK
jgi:hypothetical protein